jgi:hypothetical protein
MQGDPSTTRMLHVRDTRVRCASASKAPLTDPQQTCIGLQRGSIEIALSARKKIMSLGFRYLRYSPDRAPV